MKHLTTLALGSLLCIACRSTHENEPAPQSVQPAGEVAQETIAPEGSMQAVVERGDAPTAEELQAQADAEYARLVADLSGTSPHDTADAVETIEAEADRLQAQSEEAVAALTSEVERIVEAVPPPEDLEVGAEEAAAEFLRAGAESAEWEQPVIGDLEESITTPAAAAHEEVEATIEEFTQATSGAAREASTAPLQPNTATGFDPAAMEARMREVATPGPEHRWLDALQGRWKADVQYFVMPESAPIASTGVMTTEWALDGRFLQMNYAGSVMGQPFQGFGHIGFDKVREQYVGYWVDSMGTQMMNVSTGVLSRDQKSLTLRRQALEPLTGKEREVKEVLTIQGPNEHHWEMWGYAPDGTFFQMVRIVYRRAQ